MDYKVYVCLYKSFCKYVCIINVIEIILWLSYRLTGSPSTKPTSGISLINCDFFVLFFIAIDYILNMMAVTIFGWSGVDAIHYVQLFYFWHFSKNSKYHLNSIISKLASWSSFINKDWNVMIKWRPRYKITKNGLGNLGQTNGLSIRISPL